MQGSRIEDGCDALFLLQVCEIVVLESSLRLQSFSYFCSHVYKGSMLFVINFQFLLRAALLFR